MMIAKSLFAVLAVLGVAACVQGDTVVLNQVVDEVLASANQIITAAGKAQFPVKNVGKTWRWKWKFISVSADLECDNGHVGELNTLKRTGDASMTTSGNTVTINAQLGLGDFNCYFDTCRAKVPHLLSVSSQVTASVDSESISFQVSLTHDKDKCEAKLDHISLDSLSKIHLKTGGGAFKKVLDQLLELFVNLFKGDIKNFANNQLVANAQAAVAKNSDKICQQIPH